MGYLFGIVGLIVFSLSRKCVSLWYNEGSISKLVLNVCFYLCTTGFNPLSEEA